MSIKSVRDLDVCRLAFELAVKVFELTKKFPKEETRGWLDFSLGCGYINQDEHDSLDIKYDEVNAMLYSLINSWKAL